MKDNLLKYIVVVSLLLNFSFLGAAGYTYYHQTRHGPPLFFYGAPGRVPVGSSIQPHLFEALSLKPEQRELFEQKAPLFHEALDKKREKVDQLRRSLFDLMGSDHPDSKAIEETISEINGVQEDMQKLVVAHMLQFKSMLDKDQQKKFLDMIEGAMAQRRQGICP
jgi:Spy/CpxP family protein refolding chaperone